MANNKGTRALNGEGSVYTITGRGWHYSFNGSDGRRVIRKAKIQTERSALAELRRALAARDAGEDTGRSKTLAAFLPEWLDIKRTAGCRPRTLEAYRERIEKYVLPDLGALKLNQLTASHLDRLYAKLLTQPSVRKTGPGGGKGRTATLSPATVVAIHETLRGMLRAAKRRRLVGIVATELVEPPKVERYNARILTVAEAKALIKGVAGHRHGPLWIFMLGTGCRFGEAAGMTWSALDLDNGTAHIYQQVTRERHQGRIRLTLAPVKTDAGNRVVPLPSFVLGALRRQRELVAEMQAAAAELWQPSDLVFPSYRGDLLRENEVLVTWHRILHALGIEGEGQRPLRQHDLRHAKGTLMADAGEDTTTIQKTLGHARQSITADLYIGNTPTALRKAAERYGELLSDD